MPKLFLLVLLFCSAFSHADELLMLSKGSAKTINTTINSSTVFISNPDIADYKIINSKTVVVYGVDLGFSSIIIYNSKGEEIYNSDIIVNLNMKLLRQAIENRFPDEDIKISNVSDNIVLDGVVSSEEIKDQVYQMVGTLLTKESEVFNYEIVNKNYSDDGDPLLYTGKYQYKNIMNNLKVLSSNQINVKVTIAEVSNSFLTDLGMSYGIGNEQGTFVNKLLDFTAKDIVAVISAVGNESVGKILAEPNLTVFSGEQASFLVGGELPIAVREDNGISIHYKEYGVRLSMVAKVVDADSIRLTLQPEVSSFDKSYTTSTGQVDIPAFQTRKAKTTVQLKNGQSFILAGLLSSEDAESLSKIPYLGDIPILGALFSSTKSVRSKKELIIVATVNFVNPVAAEEIKLPVFKPSSDIERLFGMEFSTKQKQSSPALVDIINDGGFN
ncbi:type II and III secretion system protein family protein [Vibrio sp. SCSIO 43137]|uniref:type II and III secretion system protein family protein n=1 Tax=Vibrio sp. SCSIO 43137 TaxID=3021011 RepID=UPI003FCCF7C3